MKKLKITKIILSRDNRFRYEKMIMEHSNHNNARKCGTKQNKTDKAMQVFKSILNKENMYAEKGDFWPDEEKVLL